MKDFIKVFAILLFILACGSALRKCQYCNSSVERKIFERDTVLIRDTIRIDKPVIISEANIGVRRYAVNKVEAQMVNNDSLNKKPSPYIAEVMCGVGAGGEPRCCNCDSIDLPTIQKHYADSTFEAWVSGPIDPILDSIKVYTKTTYITQREWKPPKRWHVGLTAGYGFSPTGFQSYIGVGITYSIFSF